MISLGFFVTKSRSGYPWEGGEQKTKTMGKQETPTEANTSEEDSNERTKVNVQVRSCKEENFRKNLPPNYFPNHFGME